jgi:hypothetical protein
LSLQERAGVGAGDTDDYELFGGKRWHVSRIDKHTAYRAKKTRPSSERRDGTGASPNR